MKVWFDVDCEVILSTIRDRCPYCDEMYCFEGGEFINDVTMHKRNGCLVVYIEESRIGDTKLMFRDNDVIREATIDDLEKAFLKMEVLPNFAYALARLQPLEHKVIKN